MTRQWPCVAAIFVSLVALSAGPASAVVWCQAAAGRSSGEAAAAAGARKVYEASSSALLMLGSLDVSRFDGSVRDVARRHYGDTLARLEEARALFDKLVTDRAYIAAADQILKGISPEELARRLERRAMAPSSQPFAELLARATIDGARPILDQCQRELDRARGATQAFHKVLDSAGPPEAIWTYIDVWTSLLRFGRVAAALLTP